MLTLLDAIGPAIWRASWQAAGLAVLVALLVRGLGERLPPRGRFLLWAIVIVRLLVVVTPASPWSAFNLVRWHPDLNSGIAGQHTAWKSSSSVPSESELTVAAIDEPSILPTVVSDPVAKISVTQDVTSGNVPANSTATPTERTSTPKELFDDFAVVRIASSIWLAGCLVLGAKVLAAAIVLRRRLAVCRFVTGASSLAILEAVRRRIGLKHVPALLVTPECLSPFIVGMFSPRIVLPESVVTQSSTAQLRHVLAHELEHLVRGDLWTNWLMLAARTLHWFNPAAWGAVREMQAACESACDELACSALDESDRSAYAMTIVELAASLSPIATAPGLTGLFSSTGRVRQRVEHLLREPTGRRIPAPITAAMLLGLALLGLTDAMTAAGAHAPTDAMPQAEAEPPTDAAPAEKPAPKTTPHTISGRCVNHAHRKPLAGVTVRLFRFEGRIAPPIEISKIVTGEDGRFSFENLVAPRPYGSIDLLGYDVIATADGWPIAVGGLQNYRREREFEIRMVSEQSTISGKVIDANGRPVADAVVAQYSVDRHPIPGLLSAKTDANGRFKIDRLPVHRNRDGTPWGTNFRVLHPDYPDAFGNASTFPADVVVKLPAGCTVTGSVTDGVTGGPAVGAIVTARGRVPGAGGESIAATDSAGRFRLVVPESQYDFLVEAKDRVCVAQTDRECLAGEKVNLPKMSLIAGGFISGRVVNTATGESISVTERVELAEGGDPITLSLFGPSNPSGPSIGVAVDETGGFTLRAAPGENFPYFLNFQCVRMSWTTREQPPVIVKEGETTYYNMLVTPPVPPADKLKAGRELVEKLSTKPSERTVQILLEFRKLNHTVDETELWCLLMRELVAVGRDAVPQLCAELDQTTEDRMRRRLGFALRAIGDARAVPALIRAIPKTLLPSSSDYSLIVSDKELGEFMRTHHLDKGRGPGTYFGFLRPDREIIGALQRLTGQDFDDSELFNMSRSDDLRRRILQRRIFDRQAQRWQAWWEANWMKFTDDSAYQKVNLIVADETLPPAPRALSKAARLSGKMSGATLSPATEKVEHAWHAVDLDTRYRPTWPAHIPRDEAARDAKQLSDWASQTGVDLICVVHRSPDGTETFVLQAIGMKVQEISPRDLRDLDRLIAAGQLPEDRPVGELLMHFDTNSQQLVPDANAAFLFITREGNLGILETTDLVVRTVNGGGIAFSAGVGFHKGVRFDLRSIVP